MANFKQYIKTSFQDYGLPSDGHTSYSSFLAKEDIEYLYNKIKDFSRETTQWDLYKITEVISNQEHYRAQVNSLPPYSSAIINTKFFGDDGISYNKGDLVYKNLDNSVTHIKAERGGIYYLQKIAHDNEGSSNNYDLTFQYLTNEPPVGKIAETNYNSSSKIAEMSSETQITQTLKFNGLPVVASNDLYGIVKDDIEDKKINFPVKRKNGTEIPPIVKMYSKDQEEVYCDYTLDFIKGEISNIPDIIKMVVLK